MKKRNRNHMGIVAALGCIVCRNKGYGDTPAEVHHIRNGYGISQRAPDEETIPLCPIHHRLGWKRGGQTEHGFHDSPKKFAEEYGTERELLEQTNKEVITYKKNMV